MKKTLVTLALVLLLAANAHAGSLQDRLFGLIGIEPAPETEALGLASEDTGGHFTFWGLTTPANVGDVSVGLSGRVGFEQDGWETGLQIDAEGFRGPNKEQWSIYSLMHYEGDIASVLGRPYAGGFFGIMEGEQTYGPVVGTIYSDIWVAEYRHDAARQEDLFYTGLCWRF